MSCPALVRLQKVKVSVSIVACIQFASWILNNIMIASGRVMIRSLIGPVALLFCFPSSTRLTITNSDSARVAWPKFLRPAARLFSVFEQ
jgi:hypothetical protein